MKNRPQTNGFRTWFSRLILNNRIVNGLIITILVLIVLLLLSKVTWIFTPFEQFFKIVGLPIVLAGVFYYLLNPLVDLLEKRYQWNRIWSITGIFILITILIIWGIVALIPVIRSQTISLINNWPDYWNHAASEVNNFLKDPRLDGVQKQIQHVNKDTVASMTARLSDFANHTVTSLGSVLSTLTKVIIGIITMPFILFYLLKDGHNLPSYIAHFFPKDRRAGFKQILDEVNTQVSQYIRGQLIVAFFVSVLFYIGYTIIGLKFALIIGIAAGFLNLIPYLGSFLAMVPSIVVGAFMSPMMLLEVLIVFAIEQTIEGRLISPLILGSNLAIHPVTILIVLLASGQMFGILGVIFGIPIYAVLKVLITHAFEVFKSEIGGY
ncbi:AI-2E family transporter [Pediococcus claussenii]|uniref:AI-2E family transporter n=1 Tax=Pediococcus claussenii (strain ATCC BAA-344 / DSM 14800 / JCM 18046 / KCTC 3811 / LMG 21948 / P06) TaxID=701521 RepID=G8PCT5_PEDCP|nr:AI-2E family transporter [Pediococcus claussenii]AEV95070.1 hypothetical protein PECL_796 [Pediococcus claussenii ATCC BAA-344]ANZ70258.1 AI-2E family transporter [Pediococcus claussenii]ANZ72074.1 AI-2E family transporter [Pediococcus claussenii]KRN18931.1 hypothetical protein IV79_GL001774 [Pediococcus claussenii]